MQVEIVFPVDEESRKGFLESVYIRHLGEGMIEIGIAKKTGHDYAFTVLTPQQRAQAKRVIDDAAGT